MRADVLTGLGIVVAGIYVALNPEEILSAKVGKFSFLPDTRRNPRRARHAVVVFGITLAILGFLVMIGFL